MINRLLGKGIPIDKGIIIKFMFTNKNKAITIINSSNSEFNEF